MYGADRTLLAALSDEQLQKQLRADHYAFSVIEAIVPDDEESQAWDGRYVRLEGFQWLVACQAADAQEGHELEVGTLRDGAHHCIVRSVYAHWADFALVKVAKVNPPDALPWEL